MGLGCRHTKTMDNLKMRCRHMVLKCRHIWTEDKLWNTNDQELTHVLKMSTHVTNSFKEILQETWADFKKDYFRLQRSKYSKTWVYCQYPEASFPMKLISWPNSKYWKSYDQKSDTLSSWVSKNYVIQIGQLQIWLSQFSQVQMKQSFNLNCSLKNLVSNATNGVKTFQVTKKLRPIYWKRKIKIESVKC